MRAFIAIEAPREVQEAVHAFGQRYRKAGVEASWVRPENMHLTLRFLGDVASGTLDTLCVRLAEGYTTCAAFPLEAVGVGGFPSRGRPKILWAGIGPLEGGLQAAWTVAEEAARAAGIPNAGKRFHPHLTIGRVRSERASALAGRLLAAERGFSAGAFTAGSVALFSSLLTPQGPQYTRIQEFLLQQP